MSNKNFKSTKKNSLSFWSKIEGKLDTLELKYKTAWGYLLYFLLVPALVLEYFYGVRYWLGTPLFFEFSEVLEHNDIWAFVAHFVLLFLDVIWFCLYVSALIGLAYFPFSFIVWVIDSLKQKHE